MGGYGGKPWVSLCSFIEPRLRATRRPLGIIAAAIALSLSAGVAAAEPNDPVSAAMESLTRGLVQDQDVDLVFGYLREVLGAAVQGREAPPPDELRRRADEIGDEMKRRGAAAGRAMLDAIERGIREGMRDPSRLPPTNSRQRI